MQLEIASSVDMLGWYMNWVQGFWDDGVDVRHDQPLTTDVSGSHIVKFTLAFLGTRSMVVCLKHVGITDWVRERLNMSAKTLVSTICLALWTFEC